MGLTFTLCRCWWGSQGLQQHRGWVSVHWGDRDSTVHLCSGLEYAVPSAIQEYAASYCGFARWHFQMWVVHEGCDWGERLTFCVSATAWQWLRSADICESALLKIFSYEKERKTTYYLLVSVAIICAPMMSDTNELETEEWQGKMKNKVQEAGKRSSWELNRAWAMNKYNYGVEILMWFTV